MTKAQFGMIGLGTMGRNFLLNVAEQGYASVGFDIDAGKRGLLCEEGKGLPIDTAKDVADFLEKLAAPRNIMLLVPAGPIVDSVINDLLPHLEPGDLVIDGGNSHFPDTERREKLLNERGLEFLGVGVSGGEEGARRGASIMVGGKPEVFERVRPIFEAASAKVDGEPCAAHVGLGSAGHYVKMVHNGIEYAMMQLIAETYEGTRTLLSASSDAAIADIFDEWNSGELNSFLIEITATVLRKKDDETGNSLVSMILDTAGQKGTGKWTSQAAMDLGIPVPTIDSSVTMRQISAQKQQRVELAEKLGSYQYQPGVTLATPPVGIDGAALSPDLETLRTALHAAFLLAYAQGFAMLRAASDERSFKLDMVEIAKIWRGGCIIRAAMLEDIRKAFTAEPNLANLMLSPNFRDTLGNGRPALQKVVAAAAAANLPAMAFAATLNYLTAYSTERLPANLIQAQRDYFGAHTYQRTDRDGTFHTADWDA
jgi:6-phosphogluconate dehydrogenase